MRTVPGSSSMGGAVAPAFAWGGSIRMVLGSSSMGESAEGC